MALWPVAAVPQAGPQLQIASPEPGMVLSPGGELAVTVKALPNAFQSVSVTGGGPFALSTGLNAPPYRYSYAIPAGFAVGRYRLKAAGITANGTTVYSDPIDVDIERPDKPKKLESEWQSLSLVGQETATLTIWGTFADGARIDVTRSTLVAYTSDRPAVATVSGEGGVTGGSAGKARITAKYGDKTVVVPVVVTP